MVNQLKKVLDFQRFSPEPRLSAMIEEVERRYQKLDEEDLLWVSAAGEPQTHSRTQEKKDGENTGLL